MKGIDSCPDIEADPCDASEGHKVPAEPYPESTSRLKNVTAGSLAPTFLFSTAALLFPAAMLHYRTASFGFQEETLLFVTANQARINLVMTIAGKMKSVKSIAQRNAVYAMT
jgi:hypothetical protein